MVTRGVPVPPRVHAVDELPAGHPVLALPVDRGQLAGRAVSAPHRRDRLARPPPGRLTTEGTAPATTVAGAAFCASPGLFSLGMWFMATAVTGAEQDADHRGAFAGTVLPVVRDAGLLDYRVAGAQQDLSAADDQRDLAAQDGHVVQGVGRVRALELRVRLGAGAGLFAGERVRRDLDDPEACAAGRRFEPPLPRGSVGHTG